MAGVNFFGVDLEKTYDMMPSVDYLGIGILKKHNKSFTSLALTSLKLDFGRS